MGCFIAVTNAPPTPKLGPEHIEALEEAEAQMLDKSIVHACVQYASDGDYYTEVALNEQSQATAAICRQRAARLAEIRAYLESLS